MSEADQFRQYAEEALLWAAQSKTEEEKQLLLELVHTWTQAALASDALVNCTQGPRQGRCQAPQRRGPMLRLSECKTSQLPIFCILPPGANTSARVFGRSPTWTQRSSFRGRGALASLSRRRGQ
jgi:hypothetical protein